MEAGHHRTLLVRCKKNWRGANPPIARRSEIFVNALKPNSGFLIFLLPPGNVKQIEAKAA